MSSENSLAHHANTQWNGLTFIFSVRSWTIAEQIFTLESSAPYLRAKVCPRPDTNLGIEWLSSSNLQHCRWSLTAFQESSPEEGSASPRTLITFRVEKNRRMQGMMPSYRRRRAFEVAKEDPNEIDQETGKTFSHHHLGNGLWFCRLPQPLPILVNVSKSYCLNARSVSISSLRYSNNGGTNPSMCCLRSFHLTEAPGDCGGKEMLRVLLACLIRFLFCLLTIPLEIGLFTMKGFVLFDVNSHEGCISD